jgi:hypothetical protein
LTTKNYLVDESLAECLEILFPKVFPGLVLQNLQLGLLGFAFVQQLVFVLNGQLPDGHADQVVKVGNAFVGAVIGLKISVIFS